MDMPPFSLAGLRVLLADAGQRRSPVIRLELIRLRCQLVDVIDLVTDPDALGSVLVRQAPELLLIDCEQPTPELLEQLGQAQAQLPRPVLLVAEQMTPAQMRAALAAGVSALQLAGLPPQRLGALLQLALARFEHDQALQRELRLAQTQLAERKLVERARGILMREQGLDEEAAFQRLRQLAMDGGQTLAAVAARLIDADQLLRPR
ncbi:ANTAR domain-containing protein [Roseateles saccharophilus]|uniref:Response regulator receiver and ANTAR domain protein n=2 Tax=Roseateles saccharophilus TaxID=304 RepID=A0A4R3VCC7_ROSSA|nr:ANTAR domain-containing protein [Roseateles saccharophilus]MDG0831760.1 ANTAR domain-containing protein [Roseateles saccharophilus]TCV01219.1 response regulator receiver and ANTAR domain protein [Roseateles saccharophilus]